MRDLKDMSLGHRTMVTVVIVVIILLLLALIGYLTGRWDEAVAQPSQLQPASLSKHEKQILALDREAIASAYKDQIHHLFLTWAKDSSDQPRRAANGARQARVMFNQSMDAIEEREKRLTAN